MTDTQQKYLSEGEVADLLGISKRLLQEHRYRGVGIPHSRIGRRIIYAECDVTEYVNCHRVVPNHGDNQ